MEEVKIKGTIVVIIDYRSCHEVVDSEITQTTKSKPKIFLNQSSTPRRSLTTFHVSLST